MTLDKAQAEHTKNRRVAEPLYDTMSLEEWTAFNTRQNKLMIIIVNARKREKMAEDS